MAYGARGTAINLAKHFDRRLRYHEVVHRYGMMA
jgi:hypothetical protein